MKILLAADGSEYSKRAARALARHVGLLAKPPEVHVLYVHPPVPLPGAASTVGRKALEKYYRDESVAALKVAAKQLDKGGVAHKTSWVVGNVVEGIAAHVKKHDIDLVVMGSRGHGAVASVVLGSIATKVLGTVKVPVMIVK